MARDLTAPRVYRAIALEAGLDKTELGAWVAAMQMVPPDYAAIIMGSTVKAYREALWRAMDKLQHVLGPSAPRRPRAKIPKGARLARWKKTRP